MRKSLPVVVTICCDLSGARAGNREDTTMAAVACIGECVDRYPDGSCWLIRERRHTAWVRGRRMAEKTLRHYWCPVARASLGGLVS